MAPPTRMSAKDRVNMGRVVKRGEIKTQVRREVFALLATNIFTSMRH